MLHQHKSRITATHTAVLKYLSDMRQIIVAGKSPAGAPLAPLAEPERGQLLDKLDEITATMNRVVDAHAPDALLPVTPSDTAATLRWLTILLRTVTDMVADLAPERLEAKYGPLDEAEKVALTSEVDAVLRDVSEAARLLRR